MKRLDGIMLNIHISSESLLLSGISYSLYSPKTVFITGVVNVFITYFYECL